MALCLTLQPGCPFEITHLGESIRIRSDGSQDIRITGPKSFSVAGRPLCYEAHARMPRERVLTIEHKGSAMTFTRSLMRGSQHYALGMPSQDWRVKIHRTPKPDLRRRTAS